MDDPYAALVPEVAAPSSAADAPSTGGSSGKTPNLRGLRAAGVGAGQGLSMGLGTYVSAAEAYVFDRARNIFNSTPGISWEDAVKFSRAEINQTKEQDPKSYLVGNIGGSVVGAGKLAKLLPGAAATSTAGVIGNAAATGTVQGATTGFSANDYTNAVAAAKDTGLGAGFGAAAGTLGGIFASGLSKSGLTKAAQAIKDRFGTVARETGKDGTSAITGEGPAAFQRTGADIASKVKAGEQLTADETATLAQTMGTAAATRNTLGTAAVNQLKNTVAGAGTGATAGVVANTAYNYKTDKPLLQDTGTAALSGAVGGAGLRAGGPTLLRGVMTANTGTMIKGALGAGGAVPGVGAATRRAGWAAEDALIKRAVSGQVPVAGTEAIAPTVIGVANTEVTNQIASDKQDKKSDDPYDSLVPGQDQYTKLVPPAAYGPDGSVASHLTADAAARIANTPPESSDTPDPYASLVPSASANAAMNAVARLETQNGAKAVPGTNNLFNIKDRTGQGPRAKDLVEGSNDAYRKYASRGESQADFLDLVYRKYPKAWSALQVGDNEGFARELQAGGYATDKNYSKKLSDVMKSGKNPYEGWTQEQMAAKFGTGQSYLDAYKRDKNVQDWDNKNIGTVNFNR